MKRRESRRLLGVVAVGAAIALVAGLYGWDGEDEPSTEVAASEAPAGGDGPTSGAGESEAGYAEVRAVVQRTARDGTSITLVSMHWNEPGDQFDGGGWVPPAMCRPVGDLEIGLAGEQQTAVGYAPEYPADRDRSMLLGSGLAGHPTLGPFFYAAVRTSSGVHSARLRIGDEVVDTAEPEDGWAVLAVQLEPRSGEGDVASPRGVVVEVVTDDGTHKLRAEDRSRDAECQPPPPSLPSGARQASDADAAAVSAAYADTFDRHDGDPQKDLRRLISGGDELGDELLEKIRRLGENYSDISAEVDKVGIVDEHRAVVVFRLRGVLGWMLGDADLVDGRWLVSGQTFCHLIKSSGLDCPASMWDESAGSTVHAQPAGRGPDGP